MADSALHSFAWLVGIIGACPLGFLEKSLALASWGIGSFAFILFLYIAVMAPIGQVPPKRWALGLLFSPVPSCLSLYHVSICLFENWCTKSCFSISLQNCLQFDQISEVLFGAGQGGGSQGSPGRGTSEIGALVTI